MVTLFGRAVARTHTASRFATYDGLETTMTHISIWQAGALKARAGGREAARRSRRALGRRRTVSPERAGFRRRFQFFWAGDDDCWTEGTFDDLADAALPHVRNDDVEAAVAAVRDIVVGQGRSFTTGTEAGLRAHLAGEAGELARHQPVGLSA